MPKKQNSDARERVLQAAEELFHEKGYSAVSMNDIAKTLDMQKASLYHHIPQGKEQLFVEIVSRKFKRHGDGLNNAIHHAGTHIEQKLLAVAGWLSQNAPLSLLPLMQNDMPAVSRESQQKIDAVVFQNLWFPIMQVFVDAQRNDEIKQTHAAILTGVFVSLMDGLTYIGSGNKTPFGLDVMTKEAINIILYGVSQSSPST
ncbi:MAG: hypothetical protein CL920_03580 [Deltaproteobacteria bacterium]|nr:hypothetical protein [Deltaproteobacteria bacterium]|tara:strand:- start:18161 stop:18763 length:603 start_codon:yes stop_codon:yes gene_type:complete